MKTLIALLVLVATISPAAAGGRWSLGHGDFDDDPGASSMTLVEYRSSRRVLGGIRLGYEFARTSKDATYLGPFLYYDVKLGRRIALTPCFGPGWYDRGDDKDLQLALQFRSGAELAVAFDEGWRAGFMYHHLSDLSLTDSNPGAEGYLFFVAKRF